MPPRSSCTVFLNSKIEPRLSGYVLFVWVARIALGYGRTPAHICYQDIGTRLYGPVDDQNYLKYKRESLERDALLFFSRTESVPSLVRQMSRLNPEIKYRVDRV